MNRAKPVVTVKLGDSGSKMAKKTMSSLMKVDRNMARMFWRVLREKKREIGNNDLAVLDAMGLFVVLKVERD